VTPPCSAAAPPPPTGSPPPSSTDERESQVPREVSERREVSIAEIEALAQRYHSWGRWGDDDQAGALNEATPEKLVQAAGLVRKGKVFSLALPLDNNGPQKGLYGRHNPHHVMLQDGGDIASGAQNDSMVPYLRYTDDAVYMILQCATQWDALAHCFHHGQMYNGHGTEMVSSMGAHKNSIASIPNRFAGRGVLLDLARYKGRDWLDTGEVITQQDLEDCCEAQGVDVGAGDFVLLRTGHLGMVRARRDWGDYAAGASPGVSVDAAHFFCGRRVAAVAIDTTCPEVVPNETADIWAPLHIVMLVHAGIHLGEMWDLEELASDCAEDSAYEFLLVAPPLTITGSVGSPINPQAIK
jgi:kynurenine formamidase